MSIVLLPRAVTATQKGQTATLSGDVVLSRAPADSPERDRLGALWVIADGVGAPARAYQAAHLAATTVVAAYERSGDPDPPARLRRAVEQANQALWTPRAPAADRLTATVLAAVVLGDRLVVAHVGRARAYWLRGERLQQLTQDHTLVAAELRAGRLTLAEAAVHPHRNALTRCLGIGAAVEVDVVEQTLAAGDRVLLCTDGLWRVLDEAEVARLLRAAGAASAPRLLEAVRQRGGRDDSTAVTIALEPAAAPVPLLERVMLLNRLSRSLAGSLDLDTILHSVLAQVLTLSGGERAAILLADDAGRLVARATHRLTGAAGLTTYSRSVVEHAFQTGAPVLIENVLDDPRFNLADSLVSPAVRAVVAVPLLGTERPIGVLYVDSSAASSPFDPTTRDLLTAFAGQASIALEHARLHAEGLAARARQDLLLRSLSSALIAVDPAGVVTHWNPAAEALFDLPAQAAVGQRLAGLAPPALAAWLTQLIVQSQAADRTLITPPDWEGTVGARPRVVLAGRVGRLRDEHRQEQGFVLVLDDRTEQVLLEEARRAEQAERQRLRTLLGRYLAPPLVERLVAAREAVELGGARHEITVLFADVRGFTGFAERQSADEVVALLNSFLALATEEIFREYGTLDKFLGDGVMALFGAPLPVPNHALAAVRAALAMRDRIGQLRATTGTRVGFGIGINSGLAIVGNIGTEQLLAYTAIGDPVNVAARLQAEARSGEVLISGTTYAPLADRLAVEELGSIYVKGRTEPVAIYKVLQVLGDPAGSAGDAIAAQPPAGG